MLGTTRAGDHARKYRIVFLSNYLAKIKIILPSSTGIDREDTSSLGNRYVKRKIIYYICSESKSSFPSSSSSYSKLCNINHSSTAVATSIRHGRK